MQGHSPIKILKVLTISRLQDNFFIHLGEFYMPFIHKAWWVQVSRKKNQALFKDFSAIFKDIFSVVLGVSQ